MNKFELLEIKSKSVADLAEEAAKLLATLEADEFWSETLLTNSELADSFQAIFDATTKLITGLDECIPGLQQTIEGMSKILESFQTARGEIGKPSKKGLGLN